MSQTATHAAQPVGFAATAVPATAFRLGGLLLAIVIPALFWPLALSGLASAAGVTLSSNMLVVAGCSIGAFVAAVCAPIMLRG